MAKKFDREAAKLAVTRVMLGGGTFEDAADAAGVGATTAQRLAREAGVRWNATRGEWVVNKRKCLRCNKIFTPLGRYNRLCAPCQRATEKVTCRMLLRDVDADNARRKGDHRR